MSGQWSLGISGPLDGLAGSVVGHIYQPPLFESRRWHVRGMLQLSLLIITFGVRSAHLANLMRETGRKNPNNHHQHQSLVRLKHYLV